MKITKSKLPNSYMIIYGFLSLFDSLVIILSLGNYSTQTTLKYVKNYNKKLVLKKQLYEKSK